MYYTVPEVTENVITSPVSESREPERVCFERAL